MLQSGQQGLIGRLAAIFEFPPAGEFQNPPLSSPVRSLVVRMINPMVLIDEPLQRDSTSSTVDGLPTTANLRLSSATDVYSHP